MENLDNQNKTEWTVEDMFQEVALKEDVIFTIPSDALKDVRSKMAAIKHRENAELEKAGISSDKRKLSFQTLEDKDGIIKVRIRFAEKKTVTVLGVETPGEF